jgi:hypothetical protein
MMGDFVLVRSLWVQETELGGRVKGEAYKRGVEVCQSDCYSLENIGSGSEAKKRDGRLALNRIRQWADSIHSSPRQIKKVP